MLMHVIGSLNIRGNYFVGGKMFIFGMQLWWSSQDRFLMSWFDRESGIVLNQSKGPGLHSSPKETQLFWCCLSFGEECRSVNFGPNVTPKSISLGGHVSGSLTLVQGHHEKSGNQSCVSFGEECTHSDIKASLFANQTRWHKGVGDSIIIQASLHI